MPSSAAVSPDWIRTPLTVSLQRGTTIIRCAPPKAIVEPKTEEQTYSQHYGDVKRRRAPAPSPPEGVQNGELSGLARHPGLLRAIRHLPREPYRNAASLRRSKACGMADRMRDTALGDSQCITTIEDHTREPTRVPNHPVSEENSLYSSGTGGERGGEDGPAAFALPEALPSPRIVVDWSQEGPYCHGHTPSSDNALRPASHSTDEAVVRGYIGIALALLRHFEEALGTRQRITTGSLECAETVCNALNAIQDPNPRFQLLAQRIATAIALLHRRKTLEDRDAEERGVVYGEVEFPYPGLNTTSWTSFLRGYTSPLYPSRSNGIEGPEVSSWSPESPQQTQEGAMDPLGNPKSCTSFPLQTVQCRGRQQRRIAGPPPPKVVSMHEIASNVGTDPEGPLQAASSSPRPCGGGVVKGGTSLEDAAIAVPAGKRGDVCLQGSSSLGASGVTSGMTFGHSTGTATLFPPSQELRRSLARVAGRLERPYSTLEPMREPADLAVLSPSNVGRGTQQSSADPLRANLVEKLGVEVFSKAKPSQRELCTAVPFRNLEENLRVRPLVLSETHVLADKQSDQGKEDPNRASAVEALALIRCATDLIVSGEGPGFVEKQFFRYVKPSYYQIGAARPRINEGMTPAQGKYLLLHYSIAKVEAEYGEDTAATCKHLYLRDLRRMEEIILDPVPPQGLPTIETRSGNEGQESQRPSGAPRGAHSLPERSPEERMERRLPLTILSLPSSAPPQEAGKRRRESLHQVLTDCSHRLPSGKQLLQPTLINKEKSPGNSSRGTASSSQLNTMSLPKPLPSLGGLAHSLEKLATVEQPTTTSVGEVIDSSRPLSSSSASAILTSAPGFPDFPIAVDGWVRDASNSPTLSRQSSSIGGMASSASLAPSTSLPGLQTVRRDTSSFGKSFEKPPQSEGGSRTTMLSPKGSLDSMLIGEKGLKLSNRSIVRDAFSGEVTSVLFEPPKNTAGESILGTATSAALQQISDHRAESLTLPESPVSGKASSKVL